MHELPGEITDNTADETTPGPSVPISEDQSLVSAVLIARIEVLEAENTIDAENMLVQQGNGSLWNQTWWPLFLRCVQFLQNTYGYLPLSWADCKQITLLGHLDWSKEEASLDQVNSPGLTADDPCEAQAEHT